VQVKTPAGVQVHVEGDTASAQLLRSPLTFTFLLSHVVGISFVTEHVFAPCCMHTALACEKSVTDFMPPLKMANTTRAATKMTTAETTIRIVVDSPFIHRLWLRGFKNLLYLNGRGFACFE
jgi:hypothetical protein